MGILLITNRYNKNNQYNSYLYKSNKIENISPILTFYQDNERALSNIIVNNEYYITYEYLKSTKYLKELDY